MTKSCTNIKQFLKQPLQFSLPNHTEAVERGVKLTTKATSRIAGWKRQTCEALCELFVSCFVHGDFYVDIGCKKLNNLVVHTTVLFQSASN